VDNTNQQDQGSRTSRRHYPTEEQVQRRQARQQQRQAQRENWEQNRQQLLTPRSRLRIFQENRHTEEVPSTRETSQTRSPVESLTSSPEGSTQNNPLSGRDSPNDEELHLPLLQLQNLNRFFNRPIDYHSDTDSSSESEVENMTNAATVLEYLEDNMQGGQALRIQPFYGDGTQDPLQWMAHFEKVARSNAWAEAKKIRKYATFLEEDAEEWHADLNPEDMADWAAWKDEFMNKYCNTRWKNKWNRELESNRQQRGETVDAYYGRFKRMLRRVQQVNNVPADQQKRFFIKGLLPHIAPLVTLRTPANLGEALEAAQAYEEGIDMVNEVEPRESKRRGKIDYSSDEEEEEKPKKSVKKSKEKKQVTFDPAHNLDDLAKKFEKMQLNLIQKMEKLTSQVNRTPDNRNNFSNFSRNNRDNRGNRNNRSDTRTCFNCGQVGHIAWDCPKKKEDKGSGSSAHAKFVEVEENGDSENEDELLQKLLEAYLGKHERDESDDDDVTIKRPRAVNEPSASASKGNLNTFGLPKGKPIVKTEMTPKPKGKKKEIIKITKDKKDKKKEDISRPPLFKKKDFNIVEQLQKQPAGMTWADVFEIPSFRKSLFEALRKPKEKEIKLADQEYSLKTTALKCNVSIGEYTVPTIVDSGAAISIITREAMEQLGYEIEEASKSIILPATGKRTQPLGVIRDLPITIQGQTIPIDVEVIEAATYSLLLGNNWLMKAGASYHWQDQELTLKWRGKTLIVPANCSREVKEEFPESPDENNDEESLDENGNNDSDDEISEEEVEDDETVPVFLSERLNKNELDVGPLDKPQQQKFDTLINGNKDLFATDVSSLGRTNIVKHQIDVGDAKPVKQRFYRTHPKEDQFIQEEIDRMMKKGLVKKSKSPWASPVVIVKKKNGKLRFCVDYRKLNTETRKDAYPIPRIDDMLDALRGAKWFTTLDLASGYWQVEMDSKDQDKTAFITKQGTYEFTVMPFGLTNAPATFQRLMDQVLNDMSYQGVIVYLDDINIYSETFDEHLTKLKEVFKRLRAAGLKLGPDKCHFLQSKLEFLGHIVSGEGIMADPAKVEKVKNFPVPITRTQVRGFLGLASYYRKFIKDFSKIAQPLNHLLRKDSELEWTEKCQKSFDALKEKLITEPILAYPDFARTFYLTTDGSAKGLGAVLSQRNNKGQEQVIAYASKSLVGAQQHYGATELECLAVIWAIEHFYSYLGLQHFVLITDHSALKWLYSSIPKGRLARWILRLQPYDFEIQHKPGKENTNADALSRI
jgi:hypothetical protein